VSQITKNALIDKVKSLMGQGVILRNKKPGAFLPYGILASGLFKSPSDFPLQHRESFS
jgi:hypothetical protein